MTHKSASGSRETIHGTPSLPRVPSGRFMEKMNLACTEWLRKRGLLQAGSGGFRANITADIAKQKGGRKST